MEWAAFYSQWTRLLYHCQTRSYQHIIKPLSLLIVYNAAKTTLHGITDYLIYHL